MTTIGEQVRARRRELDRSQQWLGDQTGLSRDAIGRLERGDRDVSATEIAFIADALETSPEDLVPHRPAAGLTSRHPPTQRSAEEQDAMAWLERYVADSNLTRALEHEVHGGHRVRTNEELVATGVRRRLELGDGRIDPVKAAEKLGFEVVTLPIPDDDAIDGAYRPLDERGVILINSSKPLLRRRFTAAHGLGHALLHRDRTVVDEGLESGSDMRIEREADRFAAALLVDRAGAVKHFTEGPGDLGAAVAAIAYAFTVSPPIVAMELEHLGLIRNVDTSDFLQRYRRVGYRSFMRRYGRKATGPKASNSRALSPRFVSRVRHLLEHGQLNPERAALMLGVSVEKLPAKAIQAYERLARSFDGDPIFD